MYRVSSNWRNGRCRTEHKIWENNQESTFENPPEPHAPQILIAGELILSSSPKGYSNPEVTIHGPNSSIHTFSSTKLPTRQLSAITCIVQDQSIPSNPPHTEQTVKAAVFYASGSISLFKIRPHCPSEVTEEEIYIPPVPSERTSPITIAAYHHPLLITLSSSFHLSLYQVDKGTIKHTQTLSSFTSYPPHSLVLSHPSQQTYKLLLSYSAPIYPAHWGVAATELYISATSFFVSSSRTWRAFDVPFGWLDEEKMSVVREQWSRKVSEVVATETDGKWVILAGSDNVIQVYRLHSRPTPGRLSFVRSLHGHLCGIRSMALSDGRCVSLGNDGCVWVWDLEGDWGVEVRGGSADLTRASRVVFDDRKILCANRDGLEISHFDI